MRNIWVRIGLMAGGIFAVGMLVVTGIRMGKAKIEDLVNSNSDIRIPLMGIIPFQLGGVKLGDLRRLTLMRDTPKHLTGVRVEARLSDSASIEGLKDCAFLTVNDPEQLNDRTRFTCVQDTVGLGTFGTVEISHRQGGEPTTLMRTLVLPTAQIQELQVAMGPRVTPDSATLADMRKMGDSLRTMGDSIRNATRVQIEIAGQQGRGSRHMIIDAPAAPHAPLPPARHSAPATPKP